VLARRSSAADSAADSGALAGGTAAPLPGPSRRARAVVAEGSADRTAQ
jgi:hypothetical protein